ncbi:MAG: hypothetical protein JO256_05235 [Alphaproteobacteria bacterium]|nr:hypothetical protein [Alphaproteobacteria bacterium]
MTTTEIPPTKETKMEFHKPKPWRNWREFLKELGTIALGVGIALAAEQAVEWWHWQSEVAIGRTALVAEMDENNRYYARRIAIAPCLDKMIGEAQAMLDSLENRGKAAPFTVFHLGQGTALNESEWQSQRASQVLTHFPRAEIALLGRYYATVALTTGWMTEENDAWVELSVLQHPPAGLSPDSIARLRTDLARAKQSAFRFLRNSRRQLGISDQLGMARATPQPIQVQGFCNIKDDDQYWAATLKAGP